MCENCAKKQIAEAKAECAALFDAMVGDFTEAKRILENIDGNENIETLCAFIGVRVAIISALTTGIPPSLTLGHWAGVMIETEMESATQYLAMADEIARNQ